jgi:predicted nucleic acid-binding protein
MIKRVFVDTDVILDVALARKPFLEHSKIVLAMLENNIAIGHVSSNCVANIYYIFRKVGGDINARDLIKKLLKYMTVISIEQSDVFEALKSNMPDFEDAMQNYSAIRNQCACIITRNIEDYQSSKLDVYSPLEFINLYKERL